MKQLVLLLILTVSIFGCAISPPDTSVDCKDEDKDCKTLEEIWM